MNGMINKRIIIKQRPIFAHKENKSDASVFAFGA
jgi:hypothetical protein